MEVFKRRLFGSLLLWLPLAVGALFFPIRAGALNYGEIRTETRTLALDAGTSRNRFSSARILALVNECQEQANLEAKPINKSFEFPLVSGTTWYSLPSDFLQIYRVTYEQDILKENTPEALDRASGWSETTAEPTDYFIDFASRTLIGFYPYPDSKSTGTARVEYIAQATDLTTDASIPFNSITELYPYHYGLAYCAAAHMTTIDGRSDLAQLYFAQYAAMLKRLATEAKSRPSYRPSAIGRRE